VVALAVSPNGLVASSALDSLIRVWVGGAYKL
jgi:hypothetical protein